MAKKITNKFAIGPNKNVLLVQPAKSYSKYDVSKAFLIHRDQFLPTMHRVVLVSEEEAWMIRSLFILDCISESPNGKPYRIAHTISRACGHINNKADLKLLRV
jgi:hypothetical protein